MSNKYFKKFQDRQVMSQLKRKDREAFIKTYDENVVEINRFIYFKVANQEEANDLTSSVFLKAWNYVQNKNLLEAKTLRALFYKIARNIVIDYYREKGSMQQLSFEENLNKDGELIGEREAIIDESTSQTIIEDKIDEASDIRLIESKLPLLKEEYRELIVMRFINELSIAEIADISQKSKGNIRVLTHRALKALRELIEEEQAENINEG